MATSDFYCTLDFDDIDLSRPTLWRERMIELVSDRAFDTLMTDLSVTGEAIGEMPTARDWGGGCSVSGSVSSGGGWSGGISCGVRF